jgi:hypothetical protein
MKGVSTAPLGAKYMGVHVGCTLSLNAAIEAVRELTLYIQPHESGFYSRFMAEELELAAARIRRALDKAEKNP